MIFDIYIIQPPFKKKMKYKKNIILYYTDLKTYFLYLRCKVIIIIAARHHFSLEFCTTKAKTLLMVSK